MINDTPGRRVSVADDDVDLTVSTALISSISGHTSATAFNRRDAINQAPSLRSDVELLDTTLPDEDGHEITQTLRDETGLRDLRLSQSRHVTWTRLHPMFRSYSSMIS